MPNLLIQEPGANSRRCELLGDVVTIGRLPGNSIQIQNPSVSSYHAKLILRDGSYFLKDLGSTNRSWVEGVPVSESEIKRSCALRFGSVECRLVLEDQSGAQNLQPSDTAQLVQKPQTTPSSSENSSREKDLLSLTRQRDALVQTNNMLSAKLADLQKNPLQGAAAGENPELASLRRQRDALQQVINQLGPKLEEAEKKLRFVVAEREASLRANEELVLRLKEARREFEALSATRETYHNQHQSLLDTINTQKAQILSLKEERDAAIQASDEIAAGLEQMELKIKALTKERDHLAAEVDELREAANEADGSEEDEEHDEEENPPEEPVRRKPSSAKKRPIRPEPQRPAPSKSAPARQSFEAKRAEEPPPQAEQKPPVCPVPTDRRIDRIFKPVEFEPAGSEDAVRERCGEISNMMKKLQNALNYFIRHQKEVNLLNDICDQILPLRKATALVPLRPANELVCALDDWLYELQSQPQLIDASALRTSSNAVELLESLFVSERCMRLKHLWAPRALAVDDDPDVLDAVTGALGHVKLQASAAQDARQGLQKLYEQKFDLVILDVGLPGINGLDLCTEIRSMPNHAATPILFLTGAANPETRAQTAIQGGKDFIAKPFKISELGLRALTWAMKSQMQLL